MRCPVLHASTFLPSTFHLLDVPTDLLTPPARRSSSAFELAHILLLFLPFAPASAPPTAFVKRSLHRASEKSDCLGARARVSCDDFRLRQFHEASDLFVYRAVWPSITYHLVSALHGCQSVPHGPLRFRVLLCAQCVPLTPCLREPYRRAHPKLQALISLKISRLISSFPRSTQTLSKGSNSRSCGAWT